MKLLFVHIAISVFIYSPGYCQSLDIGFQINPNICDGTPINSTNAKYFRGPRTIIFSYSTGVKLKFNSSNKWSISTGVQYQKTGDKSKLFPPGILNIEPAQTISYLECAEIPLNFEWTFDSNWYYAFGLSLSHVFNYQTFIYKSSDISNPVGAVDSEVTRNNCFLNTYFGRQFNVRILSLDVAFYLQYGLFQGLKTTTYEPIIPGRRNFAIGLSSSVCLNLDREIIKRK